MIIMRKSRKHQERNYERRRNVIVSSSETNRDRPLKKKGDRKRKAKQRNHQKKTVAKYAVMTK